MPKQNAPLLAFNRGVVSPKALGRTDVERLAWSAEEQSNWVPHQLGSMMLRPGVGYLLNSGTALPKYLPFVFAIDDVALAEFRDGQVRIVKDDAYLTFVAVSAAVTNGGFESNVTSWTDADDSGATSDWAASVNAAQALITARTVYDYVEDATATAYYKLDNDGIAYTQRANLDSGAYQAISGEWKLTGAASDYESRATIVSGTASTGTFGSWLDLANDQIWSRARSTAGTSTLVFDLEIRAKGSTTTLTTARITLQATRTSSGGGGGGGGIIP